MTRRAILITDQAPVVNTYALARRQWHRMPHGQTEAVASVQALLASRLPDQFPPGTFLTWAMVRRDGGTATLAGALEDLTDLVDLVLIESDEDAVAVLLLLGSELEGWSPTSVELP